MAALVAMGLWRNSFRTVLRFLSHLSTYLGGNGHDTAKGIAIDSSGNAYVAGETTFVKFSRALNVYQSSVSGNIWNAFVTKFDVAGNPVYSTYLGGSDVGFC